MATFRYWTGDPGRGITLHTVLVSASPWAPGSRTGAAPSEYNG